MFKRIFIFASLPFLFGACSSPMPGTAASSDPANRTMAQSVQVSAEATCTGASSCNACKNCKYCKHCAKNGGTCGVCK